MKSTDPLRTIQSVQSLLRRYEPATILVHTELGDRGIACKSQDWRRLAESVIALKPVGNVELFDGKNQVIRTFTMADGPRPEEPVASSPLQSDLILISRLLADAHRHALSTLREEHQTHSANMVRLVEIAFKRLEQIESSWAKLHRQRMNELDRVEDRIEERGTGTGENLGERVMESLVAGAVAAAAQPQVAPNGAGGRPSGKRT